LLDTNVLSELMRPTIDSAVNELINRFTGNDLFISSITRAEIERGLNLLPTGRKQNVYRACADETFLQFKGRCLPFEESAAIRFGTIHAMRQRAGRPISTEDAQIASIALVHGMSIATRNIKDFKYIESLNVINPWSFRE